MRTALDFCDHINKLCVMSKCIEKCIEVSHLGLAKLVKYNQILGHAADQNYIALID